MVYLDNDVLATIPLSTVEQYYFIIINFWL